MAAFVLRQAEGERLQVLAGAGELPVAPVDLELQGVGLVEPGQDGMVRLSYMARCLVLREGRWDGRGFREWFRADVLEAV